MASTEGAMLCCSCTEVIDMETCVVVQKDDSVKDQSFKADAGNVTTLVDAYTPWCNRLKSVWMSEGSSLATSEQTS